MLRMCMSILEKIDPIRPEIELKAAILMGAMARVCNPSDLGG